MKKIKNILMVAGMMVTVGLGQTTVNANEAQVTSAPNPAAAGPSEEVVAVDNAPTMPELVIPRTSTEPTQAPNPAAAGPSEEVVAVDEAPTMPEVVIPQTGETQEVVTPEIEVPFAQEVETQVVVDEAPVAPEVVIPHTAEVAVAEEVHTTPAPNPAAAGPSEEVVAVDAEPTMPELVIPQTGQTEELTIEEVALSKTNGKQVANVLSVTSLAAGLGFLAILKRKK